MVTYETVVFTAAELLCPTCEGTTTGYMTREDAIEQFDLNLLIMSVHNGPVTECGTNADGLPFARFEDGSAMETYVVEV